MDDGGPVRKRYHTAWDDLQRKAFDGACARMERLAPQQAAVFRAVEVDGVTEYHEVAKQLPRAGRGPWGRGGPTGEGPTTEKNVMNALRRARERIQREAGPWVFEDDDTGVPY